MNLIIAGKFIRIKNKIYLQINTRIKNLITELIKITIKLLILMKITSRK